MACGLHRSPNDVVEFKGEGVEDPYYHDAIQSSPIDGWIDDVTACSRAMRVSEWS
jgi:hypothetical protein